MGAYGDSEIPLLLSFLYLLGKAGNGGTECVPFLLELSAALGRRDSPRGKCQAGSLTGAVHLSKNNAGVLRRAQRGQKPRVEQKGKSSLDLDFQYEYRLLKHGLSILLILRVSSKRCQKSYHRDNWLVAAKRS